MWMAFLLAIDCHDSPSATLTKSINFESIPSVGDWIDTGSAQIGSREVISVGWHRNVGGINLGRFAGDTTVVRELEDAGWRLNLDL